MGGIFNREKQTQMRKTLRNNPTYAEKLLWYRLKNKHLGYKFRRQFGIDKYIADFYCPQIKLLVEVDGDSHGYTRTIIRDQEKEKYFRQLGLVVKRYTDSDIIQNCTAVVEDIYRICKDLDAGDPS